MQKFAGPSSSLNSSTNLWTILERLTFTNTDIYDGGWTRLAKIVLDRLQVDNSNKLTSRNTRTNWHYFRFLDKGNETWVNLYSLLNVSPAYNSNSSIVPHFYFKISLSLRRPTIYYLALLGLPGVQISKIWQMATTFVTNEVK